jgi:hypothetical protein
MSVADVEDGEAVKNLNVTIYDISLHFTRKMIEIHDRHVTVLKSVFGSTEE